MTSVWPALCPPWKRTTMSACSDSQSTILPLPSSPHWEPTTTTFAMAHPWKEGVRPACQEKEPSHAGLPEKRFYHKGLAGTDNGQQTTETKGERWCAFPSPFALMSIL